jgi:hypothetical protein
MNYKQNRDGTYTAENFDAANPSQIIRMVKQEEQWKIEDAQKALAKVATAAEEQPTPEPNL